MILPTRPLVLRRDGSLRRRWSRWEWPVVATILYLAVQGVLAPFATVHPDSARYAELALRYTGVSEAQAHRQAVELLCADKGEHAARFNGALPSPYRGPITVEQDCLEAQADHLEPTASTRYQELFSTRPGYPAAVALLTPLTGVKVALWAVAVMATAAAGMLMFWLLRFAGLSPPVALLGQVLLYLLPVGWWASQLLTEGLVLAATVAALFGALLLARGRVPLGGAVLVAAYVAVLAVKYSTALLLALSLAVAALVVRWSAQADRRGLGVLAGVSGVVAVAVLVGSRLLGLPGLEDSVQDMLTGHFNRPDVPDPWRGLVDTNLAYWQLWPLLVPSNIALVLATAVGTWALWRWSRPLAVLVVAVGATGLGAAVAHPDVTQLVRLYSALWLIAVVGLPVGVELLRTWSGDDLLDDERPLVRPDRAGPVDVGRDRPLRETGPACSTGARQ